MLNQDIFIMYGKYIKQTNGIVYELLSGLSNDEREKDRQNFYGSLSGLFRHILGGTLYFHELMRISLAGKTRAEEKLSATKGLAFPPEGPLLQGQWEELGASLALGDDTTVEFCISLGDEDLLLPVSLDWYGGNPAEVPLHFFMNQLVIHTIHHQGQISQILDEMGIDNDFSGLDPGLF